MRVPAFVPALLALAGACDTKPSPKRAPAPGSATPGSAAPESAAPAGSAPAGSAAPAPAPSVPAVTVPAAVAGLDLGVAFAPTQENIGLVESLVARRVPTRSVSAMIRAARHDEKAIVHPFQATVATDLDRDGKVDLIEIPQARFGGRVDWVIGVPDRGKLKELFTVTGMWDGARIEDGKATLRFHATTKYDDEPRILWTLYYAGGAWAPPIKSFTAVQGKIPPTKPPYHSFEARSGATLRATPAIDDAPAQAARAPVPDDPKRPGYPDSPTRLLRGNVFVAYPPGARGLVLASEGTWRYVAFDPVTGPSETAVPQDVIPEDNGPKGAWHCGWVAAAQITE
jgi:hypothetical protein